MKKKVLVSLMVLGLLGMIGPAQAVLVSNGSTTLFSNDFEPSAGVATSYGYADPLNTTDSDPVGFIATEAVIQGVQATSWTGPGAYQGDIYARISRRPSTAFLGATFTSQSTGTIHAEWMEYIPTLLDTGDGNGDDSGIGVLLGNMDGGEIAWSPATANYIKNVPSGQVQYWHDGDQSHYTVYAGGSVLTYTPDAWCKWELDLNLDADTYTLTIDGVTSNTLPAKDMSVSALGFRAGANRGTAYIDAVPEPATMALLGLGGLLMRRRR